VQAKSKQSRQGMRPQSSHLRNRSENRLISQAASPFPARTIQRPPARVFRFSLQNRGFSKRRKAGGVDAKCHGTLFGRNSQGWQNQCTDAKTGGKAKREMLRHPLRPTKTFSLVRIQSWFGVIKATK